MLTAHPLISDFARNLNARDEERLIAIFSEDAIVRDGGQEYCGSAAIRHWIQTTIDRYALHLKVLEVSAHGKEWLFDAIVSGRFEGSPVRIEHTLTIENGKIAHLLI